MKTSQKSFATLYIIVSIFLLHSLSATVFNNQDKKSIFRASEPQVRYMPITQNFHIVTHLLTCKDPKRILWEGWSQIERYKKLENVYCVVTDDDKFYSFVKKPEVTSQQLVRLHSVNLEEYNFIEPQDNASFSLASFNPYQKAIEGDTIHFHPKKETFQELLHVMRYATKKYYLLDQHNTIVPINKEKTLNATLYNIIEIQGQCPLISSEKNSFYICVEKFSSLTYQALAYACATFLSTELLTITSHTSSKNLMNDAHVINWQSPQNKIFHITLAPFPIKKNVFAKKLPNIHGADAKNLCKNSLQGSNASQQCSAYISLQQGKVDRKTLQHLQNNKHPYRPSCPEGGDCLSLNRIEKFINHNDQEYLKDQCHIHAFIHPRSHKSAIIGQAKDHHPFAYEPNFAKLHAIDFRKNNPLDKLKPTTCLGMGELKELLVEIVTNGIHDHRFINELIKNFDKKKKVIAWNELFDKITAVNYVTPNELPILLDVKEKMEHKKHRFFGSPLNWAEMFALSVYTWGLQSGYDLCKQQRSGNFKQWVVFDHCLMSAIIKLHQWENKQNKKLYSGIVKIFFEKKEHVGFLATYVSSSPNKQVAMTYKGIDVPGMLIHITPAMQSLFPHCDVSWISKFPDEEERLFARSADIGVRSAPQWLGTIMHYDINTKTQHISFSPATEELIVRKGETYTLEADIEHRFSFIKLEKNATLTTTPYNSTTQKGGKLIIHCFGPCILSAGASIDVSGCGYPGQKSKQGMGWEDSGGKPGRYCAGGGGYRTQGQPGQCSMDNKVAVAKGGHIFGKPLLLEKGDLLLGSAGGAIIYDHGISRRGTRGGGALHITIDGLLQLAKNATFKANGQDADATTGGAGSGGTLVITCKSQIDLAQQQRYHFMACGGQSQGIYDSARGAGGLGAIYLYYATYDHQEKAINTDLSIQNCKPFGAILFCPRYLPIIIRFWMAQTSKFLDYKIVHTIIQFEDTTQEALTLPQQQNILHPLPTGIFVTIEHFCHMAKLATQQQQYQHAINYHKQAIALYQKHPKTDEALSLSMLYQARAMTHEKKGDYKKATYYYQQAGQKPISFQATSKIIQDAQKEEVRIDYMTSQGLSMYIPLQATDTAVDQNTEIKDYPFADFMACFLGETLPSASIPYNDESDTKEDIADTDITNNNPKHPNKANHNPNFLPQEVQNKLKNSQLLLLQGASGAGKSLCGRYISQQYNQQKHKIPFLAIFISLPKMYAGKNLLVKGLIDKGLDIVTITNLQKRTDVCLFFILDGFDEIVAQYQRHNLPLNIAERFGLKAWKNSHFMISCRSQVLNETQKQDYFGTIPEVHLLPFSAKQVNHYIKQFATNKTLNIAQWSAKEYQEKLAPFQGLTDMTREPFSLGLILNVLPRLTLMYSATEQLSRAQIYTAFSDQWFERQIAKLQQHQTLDKTSATLQATFLEYCCDLALTMFQQDTQIANPHQDSDIWQRFFTQENQINLQTSPLRKVGKDSYMFIHKSYQEYFVAYRFIQELLGLPSNPSNWQADHFIGLSFNQKENQTAFNKATPIIHFMIDYLHSQEKDAYTGLQKCLFNIIAFSKENEQVATIAANSATILAMADVKLHDFNWQGIRIPGANLDQAFLARTNFSGSDCRNVSLRQAYLENTIWNNAQVQGIDFGEYPYLQHTYYVKSVSWSPDGKKLASSASYDNTVRIWDGTTGNFIKACTGHTAWVNSVSWSPDGKKLASASYDKTVRIWDGTTGNFIKACTGHTAVVNSVSWSPDGKKLASASYDNTVRIWDGTTGNFIKACTGHTSEVNSVSWSPDGKKLASASYDKTVRIWDGTTGNFIKACGHTADVNSVSWSPDGKKLASASYDKTVRIWDGTTGNVIKACTGHTSGVNSVSWSPDGKKLASASSDKTVRIWDGTTGNVIKACTGHTSYVISVSWSPDGKKLASASYDNTVRIWDGTTGNVIKACTGHTAWVNSVSWSPDGKKLASASSDNTVRIWDGTTGNFIKACTGHTGTVWSVSWSPDGKKLASASSDNTVRIWDGTTGNVIKACTGHTGTVWSVSWSPDGKKLASASSDKTVRIWDGTTGNVIKACTGHTSGVNSVSWSPDGKKLASASSDKTVRIWDGTTGNVIKACTGHTSYVISVSWSPDGKKLASASYDNTVRIWDGTTGNVIKACTGHTGTVWSVSWSPDGKKLASASKDTTVRIWDGTTGNFIKAYTGHTSEVNSVSWSPDGKKLASASYDKTVRIWDGTTGNVIKACTGHTSYVKSVSWSPDGKKLASASSDKTVRIWDGTTGNFIKACKGHTADVKSVSWSPDGKKLASASSDNTVRIWDGTTGEILMMMGNAGLSLNKANFQRAIGLSPTHQKLIKQRGGICDDKNVSSQKEPENGGCLLM